MEATQVSNVQPGVSVVQSPGGTLYDGKVISGRVIGSAGNGQFIVSVAGQKVLVHSAVDLAAGSTFSATVRLADGKIFLVLVGAPPAESAALQNLFVVPGAAVPPNVAHMLASLGLPPTERAFRLVQLLRSLGAKVDAAAVRSALLAAQTAENGDKTAELALLLALKGFFVSPAVVQRVRFTEENRKHPAVPLPAEPAAPAFTAADIRAYLDSADAASAQKRYGFLTLFNMLAPVGGAAGHWIVLPFSVPKFGWTGDFRVLVKNSEKFAQKISIFLENQMQKLCFVLYFRNASVESVRFGFCPPLPARAQERYAAALAEHFGVDASYFDFDSLSGFCAGNDAVSVFEGNA